MSSGYSSLEEDAEDFFFTARTSFFRRAPPGKSRSGQPVSGVRQGRGWGGGGVVPAPRVSPLPPARCSPEGGRAGCRGWPLPFRIPKGAGKPVQWAWGARGEGRRWKGREPDGLGRSARRGRGLRVQLREPGGVRAARGGSVDGPSGATAGSPRRPGCCSPADGP